MANHWIVPEPEFDSNEKNYKELYRSDIKILIQPQL